MAYIEVLVCTHTKRRLGRFLRSCYAYDDQEIFNIYYAIRRLLIENNDWRYSRCFHYDSKEHQRRSARIHTWFEYKINTRGQELVANKLKGNDNVWDRIFQGVSRTS